MSWKWLVTFNVISILVGVAGFLSAVVGMFVNVADQISVKWLLLALWLCITIVLMLFKIMHDLLNDNSSSIKSHESPIKFSQELNILIIRKNPFFPANSLVGCYWVEDEVETISFLGTVHHVQDDLIQIKLLKKLGSRDVSSVLTKAAMKKIIIRPAIPLAAISELELEGDL